MELSVLERLKHPQSTYNLEVTLAPSFLIGPSSFLQVTRTSINARKNSNLNQIRLLIVELVALECLEKQSYRLTIGETL